MAAAQIREQTLRYRSGQTELQGSLAWDEARAGTRPGVLVVHEWWGCNDYVRRRARMLAELGYVAMAVDMYGDGRVANSPDEAGGLMQAVLGNRAALESRFEAAVDLLRGHPSVDPMKIGAIGYCFGGAVVLHAARIGMTLTGVVSFHGSLGALQKAAPDGVKARVLACHGAADALIPQKDVDAFEQEMSAAHANYRLVSYPGAMHSFTNPDADANAKKYGLPLRYDAAADQRSWQDMQDFFAAIFA